MKPIKLPAHIHVDPNMHPRLYSHLLDFAIVFDKVSLYAPSGHYFDLHRPEALTIKRFTDIVRQREASPFVLTAPSDWYDPEQRKNRLNQDIVGWSELDERILGEVGSDNVIYVKNSPEIRKLAETATRNYHRDVVLSREFMSADTHDSPKWARVRKAHHDAYKLYRKDRENQDKRLRQAANKKRAMLSFDGKLPAVLYHEHKHTDVYKDCLADGDPLSLLIFEHTTKPHIIASINGQAKKRRLPYSFKMYVADEWHKLLMGAAAVSSSASLIQIKRDAIKRGRLADLVMQAYDKRFQPDPQDVLAELATFRECSGPRFVRAIIEKNLGTILQSDRRSVDKAMEQSVRELAEFCRRAHRYGWAVLSSVLLPVIVYGIPEIGIVAAEHIGGRSADEYSALLDGVMLVGGLELWRSRQNLMRRWAPRARIVGKAYLIETLNYWTRSGQPNQCTPGVR